MTRWLVRTTAEERAFEKKIILAQSDEYLATDVLEKVARDDGYRFKVNRLEEEVGACNGYLLDIGSNTAGECEYLETRGYTVIATDINEHALAISQKRCARYGPPAPHYVAGYLILGALGLLGANWALHRRRGRLFLPALWVVLAPALLVLPFSGQRRLIIGAPVALSLFAALGAVHGLALPFGRSRLVRWLCRRARYSRRGMRRLFLTAVLALVVPTNVLLVAGNSLKVLERSAPIYHTQHELEALDWLRAHSTPSDVVLCAYETGNYVPARARVRVVLGLGTETVHAERKRAEVRRFYDPAETDAWRRDLLARYAVTYVLVGPEERALGAYDPSRAPYLVPVYENGVYALYAVGGSE